MWSVFLLLQAMLQALLSKCPALPTRGLSHHTPPHPTPTLLLFTLSGAPTPNRTPMHRSVQFASSKDDRLWEISSFFTWICFRSNIQSCSPVIQALIPSQQQGAYYTQPLYAAPPHVIHHTTVVQPNGMPAAMYAPPIPPPRHNGVAMGMVAGTTMAMSAGEPQCFIKIYTAFDVI